MANENVVSVENIKERIKAKENVAGMTFVNARGARGVVLEGLSEHKKRQAEMTCTVADCTETHIREQSDWHQSYACRTHGKSKSRSGSSTPTGGIKTDDGQVFRYMPVGATDDDETIAMKEANNSFYEALKAQRDQEAAKAKADREAERKAKTEAGRRDRALKLAEDKKAKLAEQLSRIKQYAADNNIPVSDVTLRMMEREGK